MQGFDGKKAKLIRSLEKHIARHKQTRLGSETH